jgi:hypothetical protein
MLSCLDSPLALVPEWVYPCSAVLILNSSKKWNLRLDLEKNQTKILQNKLLTTKPRTTPMDQEWKWIQELRRKGVYFGEFWNFLVQSPPHQQAWICYQERGSLDLLLAELFLSPEHRRVLEGEIGSLNAISELDPWKLFQKAPPRLKDLAILRLSLQGKSVLPWFQEILKTSQGELKKTVILALGKMSISCPEAQELFQEVLQEDAPEIRIPTLYALGENTLLAQKHLPFIVHSLSEPEDDLRIHATRILEQIGAEAQVAVPALEAILQDENPFIREQAKNALRTITGKEISEQALRSSSGFPRKRVLGFSVLLGILLILYSYSEEWMYPLFVKARLALMLISESNYYQQREITLAIGNADQGRLQSLGVLIQDLQHAKWGVRLRAVRHLAYYKESSALIIPPLCESLQDPHWTVRYASIQSLEQLAQGDVQVLSLLEKLQKKEEEPDEYVRRAAKKAWLHLQRSQNPKQKKNR